MNILITGIHGFVGGNLVSALMGQHTIFGLDIVFPMKEGVVATFAWNQLDKIPNIDIIIHLAGKAHDTKDQINTEAYFEINTVLTERIFSWFLGSNACKFVFLSSVKAAANSVNDILTENLIPAPKGPYGESKLAAEKYILQYLPLEKQAYILRPCMIHGPGNKGNLNRLYKLVKLGIPWPLGSFDNYRSFCSVDNLSFVIGNLIEKGVGSGVYQIADDQPISTCQLVNLIAESLQKKSHVWNVNQTIVRFFAKIGDVLHLTMNTEELRKLTESYVVSNEKIKSALGIKLMPVNSIDGMRRTLESFKEQEQ